MHPAALYWWKRRQCGFEPRVWASCDPATVSWVRERWAAAGERFGDFGAGTFGVRRPLRFLAYKLDLDDSQVAELARILDELKIERLQAEADRRRTMAAFADAVSGEQFDESRAAEGAGLRVGSAERIRDSVIAALRRIHALLDESQRERFAYLIRTGALSF